MGLLVTLFVHVVYTIALKFEGCAAFFIRRSFAFEPIPSRPFTDMIYSTRSTPAKTVPKKEL
jgi:hypothetical protein